MLDNQSWYIIYLQSPLCEAPLLRLFKSSKIELEFYYPKYKAEKVLKKKIRATMRPVFSTYAFVRCDYTPKISQLVEKVTGCYFVVGASTNPLPVEDGEMDAFKETIKTYITSGAIPGRQIGSSSQVEIISGSLAGYTATVKAVLKDLIIVELEMMGRTVPITLKKSEVSAM